MSFKASNDSFSHQHQQGQTPLQHHQMIALPSAILFTCLAPATVLGNGFLLLTFYRNSSSLLRTPSNFFIFSMAWANFLTGFVLQPLLAYNYYTLYLNETFSLAFRKVMAAFSIVTMNASIFSVCAFSWDSFLALARPIKHRKWVTIRRAKVVIACLWIYQIGFASLLFTNIPLSLVLRVDLHLNTTLISTLLLACYVCLYKAFKQRERKRERSFSSPRAQMNFRTRKRSTKLEQLMRVIIFLFTLVTTIPILPVTVVWHLTWYCSECQRNQQLVLAEKVLNQVVFVKFVLDPFVYAWRLERYRTALKRMLCCNS